MTEELNVNDIVCNHCGKSLDTLAEAGEHYAKEHKGEDK